MRLVYNFVFCLLLAESNGGRIEDIYVVDPKKSLNAGWESIHFIVAANTHWREAMEEDLVQKRFVEAMIDIPGVVTMTPVSTIKIIDETPYCWTILAYNSAKDRNAKKVIKYANALQKVFYERCGVATLDLSYPSNSATFGKIVSATPSVIVRFPDHPHKMFTVTDMHEERHHIGVQSVSSWGTVISHKFLEEQPVAAFKKMLSYYDDSHVNYKTVAVYMDHYGKRDKRYIQNKIHKLIKGFHDTAVKHAERDGLEMPHKASKFMTKEKKEKQRRIVQNHIASEISGALKHIDLARWLRARIAEDEMEGTQVAEEEKRLEPQPIPDLAHLLNRRVEL